MIEGVINIMLCCVKRLRHACALAIKMLVVEMLIAETRAVEILVAEVLVDGGAVAMRNYLRPAI